MWCDVSSNQGKINWQKVKAAGVTDVTIRLSMGTGTIDKMAHEYAVGVQAVGINIHYYHFAYPDKKYGGTPELDAASEANWFIKCLQGMPQYGELMLDMEQATTLTSVEFNNWLHSFIETLESAIGCDTLVYTYKSYMDQHLPHNHTFGNKRMVIANYSVKDNPPLPIGWSTWWLHQYDEKGHIDGIATTVDLNKRNPNN